MSDLQTAAKRLLTEARREFPTNGRCVKCGFRALYHEPSSHPFQAPEHPFVSALRGFIAALGERDGQGGER